VIHAVIDCAPISPNRLLNEHWQSRAHRRSRERKAVGAALSGKVPPPGPWVVTLTRVGAGEADSDNLWASMKGFRDQVAAFLGCDDSRRAPIVWEYRQRKARELAKPYKNGLGRLVQPKTKFRVWCEVTIATDSGSTLTQDEPGPRPVASDPSAASGAS
jgi:hypothetical protein